MMSSIAPVVGESDAERQLQTLQQENNMLRQQLSRSVTSLISNGKVNAISSVIDDRCMYNNFLIGIWKIPDFLKRFFGNLPLDDKILSLMMVAGECE